MRAICRWTGLLTAGLLGACDQTAPRGPGAIRVTANATSQEGFGFQYGVSIDSGTPRTAFMGVTLNFLQAGLSHGPHLITVSGTPANCTGKDPQTATLAGDDTVLVTVAIACPRTSGDLKVNVATTGSDLDANGYFVRIDAVTRGFVLTNGNTTIPFLNAGAHNITLSDVAANCTLTNSQDFTITAGVLTTVNLTVTCAPVAVLRFVATASGPDRDPDGYQIRVDNQLVGVVLASQTGTLRVTPGTRAWAVSDIQPNCAMGGATSGNASPAAGDTVTITLTATCTDIPMGSVGTSVVDPVNDTVTSTFSGTTPPHDVLGVTARYATDWLILVLRFSKPVLSSSTLDPKALYGFIEFDSDESQSTGMPASSNTYGTTASLGVDYLLTLTNDSVSAGFMPRVITGPTQAGRVRTRFEGDSVIIQIPLSKFGTEDGSMAMVMTIGTQDRPTDVAPNSGAILMRLPGAAPSIAPTPAPSVVAKQPQVLPRLGVPWWR